MKMLSNMLIKSGITSGIAVLTMSLVAVPVLALEPATTSKGATTTTGICKNVTTLGTNAINEINNRVAKLATERQSQDQKVAQNRSSWLSELQSVRAKDATARQAQYTKLEAKATTDAQKAAVQAYEKTVNVAIATRIAAHDANRTTYFNGVDAVISAHRSQVDAAVSTFKQSVNTAVSAAQAGCANGTSADQVRTTFKTALKNARDTFKTSMQSISKESSQVKSLNDARQAANAQADATFKTTVSSAAAVLKQAFGSKSSNV